MSSEVSSKCQIDALTGIRIVAAAYLFFYHVNLYMFKPLFPALWPYTAVFFQGGWLGVDLFFLLSGFIISYNYYESFALEHEKSSYVDFLFKRLARIYPVHLFTTLVVFIPVLMVFGANLWGSDSSLQPHLPYVEFTVTEFVKNLFLVQAWSLPTVGSWNAVSWSVSCEWLAYLCFPLLVMITKPLNTDKKLMLGMASIIVLTFISVVIMAKVQGKEATSVMGLIRIASEFTMGMVLYRLYQLKPKITTPKTKIKTAALVFGTVFVICSGWSPAAFIWTVPFCAWLILAVARGRVSPVFLSSKVFVYGGKLSYSLYLCHGSCLILALLFLPPENFITHTVSEKALYIGSFVTVCMALSIFCYHAVESPSRNFLIKNGMPDCGIKWLAAVFN